MPIYAYKCGSCGFAKDALQKVSDAPLTTCPSCGAEAFSKQVTAAGFQLKGSGWYVTDFRGNGGAAAKPVEGGTEGKSGEKAATEAKPAEKASTDAKPATDSKPAEKAAPAKTDTPPASPGGSGSAGH